MGGTLASMAPSASKHALALWVVLLGFPMPGGSRAAAAEGPEPTLTWEPGNGFRSAALAVPPGGPPGFSLLPSTQTGITFSNHLGDATVATNRLLEIGSGVALGDVDGDGLVDIYFCRLEGGNVLYRNRGGWRFEDITLAAGVGCADQFSTGCVLADEDGDGDLDLLVNSLGGGTRLFRNDGTGRFQELKDSGLSTQLGASSMALGDVDADGDLDLYVAAYRSDTFQDAPRGLRVEPRRQPDGQTILEPRDRFATLPVPGGGMNIIERGEPDIFYVHRAGGKFIPTPWHVGVFLEPDGSPIAAPPTDWGLAVMFRDLNGDRLPDLYVCNDFVYWPDRIWLNQNSKRFRAADPTALRCTSLSSMAVDVADINRDGFDDLFVIDMLSPRREERAWQRPDTLDGVVRWPVEDPVFRPEVTRNTLHLARGDGTFAEIAQYAGVAATDWSWSATFLDVDLDGWEDLLVTSGHIHDVQDMDAQSKIRHSAAAKPVDQRLRDLAVLPARPSPSTVFRNRRDLTFEDVSTAWGFAQVGMAHGMACADLDNDGDLDVVINALNAPARILRNNATAPRIAVRLKGTRLNTRGINARITVRGGPVVQSQEMICGGRYLSGDDAMRVFAAGGAVNVAIDVQWRSGAMTRLPSVPVNRVYEISEAAASPEVPVVPAIQALFHSPSNLLQQVHVDAPFDDMARQPLLPRKLSTAGPGLAWADLDNDGREELIVGGGREGRTQVFGGGPDGFREWTNTPLPMSAARDQLGILAWHAGGGAPSARVLVGESSWEDGRMEMPPAREYRLGIPGAPGPSIPVDGSPNACGALAMADMNGDGAPDLFVGGGALAGRYPEAGPSRILAATAAGFRPFQVFTNLGLVNGAVWTDLDADGQPELALAIEWGPVRILKNQGGRFEDRTREFGLDTFTGRWNGITSGDFDGDGRQDLAASNWGENWRTDPPFLAPNPVELYFGEWSEPGVVHTLLASLNPGVGAITPWREFKKVRAAVPSLADGVPSLHAYGRMPIAELLKEFPDRTGKLPARFTASAVFLNRGDRFEVRPLPAQAQFSAAFGMACADFDGDGHEDLAMAQNFFGVDAETSRQDAGVGLILLGDGKGGFRPLGPGESGIQLFGEQRAVAVADFNRDGRPDLAWSQRSGPTRLFANQRGNPGVRIRIRGPAANPDSIGATVRLRTAQGWGPAREIHLGSGYLSQDSSIVVVAAPAPPAMVAVRWPGASPREWPWPAGAASVVISEAGIAEARE